MRPAPVALGVLALLAASAASATADAQPVLAVLYFDNNTGDGTYDVLQKGFADMLITDLASSSEVVVVERERMQDVLAELKLQRGRYFDKKTAVRIGKGLGARYAVAGSFVAIKPKVRINTRLIEVSSGRIVFGTSVVGKPGNIFDLEQELVGKFLAGLQMRFDGAASKKTRVPDLSTVIEYSKGIDLADKGNFELASKQFSTVVSAAPSFVLARVRRAELIKRWNEIKAKRDDRGVLARAKLAKRTEAILRQDFVELGKEDAALYLGYRELRGQLLLLALRGSLTPSDRVKWFPRTKAERRRALQLARAYYDNTLQLFREHKAYQTRFARIVAGQRQAAHVYNRLPPEDKRLRMEAGINPAKISGPNGAVHALISFALQGRVAPNTDREKSYYYAPPLGEVDKKRGAEVLRILAGEWKQADRRSKNVKGGGTMLEAVRFLEVWADYYLMMGRREDGIKKLQEIIDRYPGAAGNSNRERRIERELGIDRTNELRNRERFAKGLREKCADPMDVNVGMRLVIYERQRRMGYAGVLAVVKEVERACKSSAKTKSNVRHLFSMLYATAARIAASNGYCDEFERLMAKSMDSGRPASEVAAFRKRSPCARGARAGTGRAR